MSKVSSCMCRKARKPLAALYMTGLTIMKENKEIKYMYARDVTKYIRPISICRSTEETSHDTKHRMPTKLSSQNLQIHGENQVPPPE